MTPSFHLSLGVRSLEESVDFFTRVLKAQVVHRDPSGYVNIDFHGAQITLKPNADIVPKLADFHFGVNLNLDAFEDLAAHIAHEGSKYIVMSPEVRDAGTPLERKKMYLKSPTGYGIELKGYREP